MIQRDLEGFVLQHPIDKNSGGDTSRTTGMLAMFGSRIDRELLLKHEKPKGSGLLCRHPKFYSDDDFTRDQMLPIIGALYQCQHPDHKALAKRIFWSRFKCGFLAQNYMNQFPEKDGVRKNKGLFGRDPLSPSHIGMLILAGEQYWLFWLLPFCYVWAMIDIFYHAKVVPRNEPNQLIAVCMTYDLLWLWVAAHPNWKKSIEIYWCGWRDQKEIYEYIVSGVLKELTKEHFI